MTISLDQKSQGDIKLIWKTFKSINSNVRIRDAANILGYSEAQLLSTSCGESVVRLKPDWENILFSIKKIGTVMVLTQNDSAISKNIGTYPITKFRENVSSKIGDKINLRLNVNNWRMAFAVEENNEETILRSFQFFDEHGTAVHKVYLTKESNSQVYDDIVKI